MEREPRTAAGTLSIIQSFLVQSFHVYSHCRAGRIEGSGNERGKRGGFNVFCQCCKTLSARHFGSRALQHYQHWICFDLLLMIGWLLDCWNLLESDGIWRNLMVLPFRKWDAMASTMTRFPMWHPPGRPGQIKDLCRGQGRMRGCVGCAGMAWDGIHLLI